MITNYAVTGQIAGQRRAEQLRDASHARLVREALRPQRAARGRLRGRRRSP
jgi:hypothetical protein